MEDDTFLLYGAYGYTGQLIARLAAEYGLKPILAGRNEAKLKALAKETGFEYLVVNLADTKTLIHALHKVPVVLHAAGPFIHTAQPMIEACLETKTHYLDITGEIEVFELAHRYGPAAEQNDVMLMPGTGFDVVPTDCMAKYLAEQLPDATHLDLAFAMRGGRVSHGTAKTMVEGLGESGKIRKNGKITDVPLGHRSQTIAFAKDFSTFTMSIPWGDVSTAYYTTGIPNITTFTRVTPGAYSLVGILPYLGWLLKMNWLRSLFRNRISAAPAGPTDEERASGSSYVWGQVSDDEGQRVTARFRGPEGYTLTAHASLIITKRVLDGEVFPGHLTPAGAYGPDLVLEIPGTERELI
jgi:short subunit dehydrogenase-like uncharacterized protein